MDARPSSSGSTYRPHRHEIRCPPQVGQRSMSQPGWWCVPSSTPPGESQVGVSAFTVMGYVSGRVVRETLTLRLS